MSESKGQYKGHFGEPWVLADNADGFDVNAQGGFGLLYTDLLEVSDPQFRRQMKRTHERAVACVNACDGINPEAVPMMVKFISEMSGMGWDLLGAAPIATWNEAVRILTLATGEKTNA